MLSSRSVSFIVVLLAVVQRGICQYPYNYKPESGTSQVVNGVMDGIDMVLLRFIDTARKSTLSLQNWGEQIGFLPPHRLQPYFYSYYRRNITAANLNIALLLHLQKLQVTGLDG
ncbi:hypothetical protein QR680_013824 [Steinernema hermaphroditum]|uniref:Neurotransmitter-gated ion-channel ligand-binding domain-containing protein n=1 Tax=Steinernema hermaphroditum TaxID=289476 RepID=A0AA39M308_9BILA|nr:hypothetical protein QR680_013824 [Steinernema hermaphroditum]